MIFKEPEEQLLELANSCPPTALHPKRCWKSPFCKSRPGFLSHPDDFFLFFFIVPGIRLPRGVNSEVLN